MKNTPTFAWNSAFRHSLKNIIESSIGRGYMCTVHSKGTYRDWFESVPIPSKGYSGIIINFNYVRKRCSLSKPLNWLTNENFNKAESFLLPSELTTIFLLFWNTETRKNNYFLRLFNHFVVWSGRTCSYRWLLSLSIPMQWEPHDPPKSGRAGGISQLWRRRKRQSWS